MAFGWLALFGPVYVSFAAGPWRAEENAHAPFLMAIILAAAASVARREGLPADTALRETAGGAVVAALGAMLAAYGHATQADVLASGAQGVVAAGAAVMLYGARGLRLFWFPLALTLYLVIWPGWLLDALTLPLKLLAAQAASEALYAFGLPVGRAGAVMTAGPYRLLVADACSGLNGLIALTAVGAVYMKLANRASRAANLVVLALLAPIAVAANILRVMVLVLITLFFGYDAGVSFLHEGAGLVLFAAALGLVFLADAASIRLFPPKRDGAP